MNKKTIFVVLGILVVIIIGFFVWSGIKKGGPETSDFTNNQRYSTKTTGLDLIQLRVPLVAILAASATSSFFIYQFS